MEEHRHKIDQMAAMSSGEICAVDHSHKVCNLSALQVEVLTSYVFQITKHIVKVLGERIFTVLLTVTNEISLIRICNLVATEAHSQFKNPLKQMRQSLELYGHLPVQLFFTDNLADKVFLESSFLSLLQGVTCLKIR